MDHGKRISFFQDKAGTLEGFDGLMEAMNTMPSLTPYTQNSRP